jgi:hypothetical protein
MPDESFTYTLDYYALPVHAPFYLVLASRCNTRTATCIVHTYINAKKNFLQNDTPPLPLLLQSSSSYNLRGMYLHCSAWLTCNDHDCLLECSPSPACRRVSSFASFRLSLSLTLSRDSLSLSERESRELFSYNKIIIFLFPQKIKVLQSTNR